MKLWVVILVVLVTGLVTGVMAWQVGRSNVPSGSDTGPRPAQVVNGEEPESNRALEGRGTLAVLMGLDRDLECTITVDGTTLVRTTGTAFIHDGQLRTDVLIASDGTTTPLLTSMIVSRDTLYVWAVIDDGLWGVKRSVGDTSGLDAREPVRTTDEVQYVCRDWTAVDRSVFVPPSKVLFRDLSSAAEAGMEYGTVFESGLEVQ